MYRKGSKVTGGFLLSFSCFSLYLCPSGLEIIYKRHGLFFIYPDPPFYFSSCLFIHEAIGLIFFYIFFFLFLKAKTLQPLLFDQNIFSLKHHPGHKKKKTLKYILLQQLYIVNIRLFLPSPPLARVNLSRNNEILPNILSFPPSVFLPSSITTTTFGTSASVKPSLSG